MTKSELRGKIRSLALSIYKDKTQNKPTYVEYEELVKFPELKEIIVTLLTSDYDSFVSFIDWVAPRPTTFRINLKNGQEFYLIYHRKSWIAQIEGKKYYLLNLPEEQRAVEAIARMLRYNYQVDKEPSEPSQPPANAEPETAPEEIAPEEA
jgi:hypothetical protein